MTHDPRMARVRIKDESDSDAEWQEAEVAARGASVTAISSAKAGRAAPAHEPDTTDIEADAGEAEASPQISPRDLRRARRRAKKLGLEAEDDLDAWRQLKARGVDLDSKSSIFDIVPSQKTPPRNPGDDVVEEEPDLLDQPQPNHAPVDDETRAIEIARIRRGLVRRRRRRLAMMFAKLAFFVLLPTVLVGHYYYFVASDMYETKSEFVIQKAESTGPAGLGSLFSGTGFATSQDSITVQGYLTSREAMRRLDEEEGFVAHFQDEAIDEIQRLPADATEAEAFKLYQKQVSVGFDPTEGIIRMSVVAADPATSERFNWALIAFAEERVDHLSQRVRTDQMAGAQESYDRAEADLAAAQARVLDLQQQRGVLSAEAEISAQMTLISSMEMEREAKALDLAEIEASRPNSTRAAVLRDEIARLDGRIAELRNEMTENGDQRLSLARITSELRIAEADLANRTLMLQTALQQLETARIEANRQVRYLSIGVSPVSSDTATYPRKAENTALAFVIFMGLYILVSLTVSILREQVSV